MDEPAYDLWEIPARKEGCYLRDLVQEDPSGRPRKGEAPFRGHPSDPKVLMKSIFAFPPVVMTSMREGFGSKLVRRAMAAQFGGRDRARLLWPNLSQNDADGLFGRDRHIPVAVPGGRGVSQNVVVDPLDRVADRRLISVGAKTILSMTI
jgi:hypothetical protein